MNWRTSPAAATLDRAASALRGSRYAVALTGAGISTPSGIPDFRSSESGLWAQCDPMEVASLTAFREHPEKFFEWFRPLAGQIASALPNPAHMALAALEGAGRVRTIITQNIDALHHRAGSRNVVEVHGSVRSLTCTRCFRRFDSEAFLPAYLETGRAPQCGHCGGILKPDAILFGEQLPRAAWRLAEVACQACDLMLVVGSSLEVLPVASLPLTALEHGAQVMIINQSATYLDARAEVTFADDAATVLPALADKVLNG